jgi:putative transposase
MPDGLTRYQGNGDLHFITFSCFERRPLLARPRAPRIFEETLERVRRWYGFGVLGYVVMPEHVHLLVSEPERGSLSLSIQMLKQLTGHKLRSRGSDTPFWHTRYYDFNVRTAKKRIEKLRYMHRNPVVRGLVQQPEDWEWSSFRHYQTGVEGVVEIESEWTALKRERAGIRFLVKVRSDAPTLSPKSGE